MPITQARAKDFVKREPEKDLYARRTEFLFGRYNENHDSATGQFSSGDGGAATEKSNKSSSGSESEKTKDSASALFDKYNDPSATAGGQLSKALSFS